MTERARSFGSVAAAHERFRPGYPDALVDEVLGCAGSTGAHGPGDRRGTRVLGRIRDVLPQDVPLTADLTLHRARRTA
jgi:hypothetical protein